MEFVLCSSCLRYHVYIGLAAISAGGHGLKVLAWRLRSFLVYSRIEVRTTWLCHLFESISDPALTLIDLYTDRFLIRLTLQLLLLFGVARILQPPVRVHLLHDEVVGEEARLALKLRVGLGLGLRLRRLLGGARGSSFLDF